jgi:hypothetical protein
MKKLQSLAFVALFLAVFLGGCAETPYVDESALTEPLPGAEAAIQIIQHRLGLTSRPQIFWQGGARLVCNNGTGWKSTTSGTGCSDGAYGGGVVVVSDWGRTYPIHETSLGHEFLHYRLDISGRDLDVRHTGPEWQDGGLLSLVRADLIQAGY